MSEAFVLRDVDVQAAAYALRRPGSAAPVAVEIAAAPTPVQTLDEQLAERYQDGLRAGYAAQAEAAFRERQAAADEELERALALATEDGYARGWAKATEEARLAAEESARELAQRVRALEDVAASISGQVSGALEAAEDQLVGLCHDVVCRILGEAAPTQEGIRGLVNQALQDLPGQVQSIHVHPDDLAICQALGGLANPGIRWMADSSVMVGGAVLKGDQGSLDAKLETQLTALADKLRAVRTARHEMEGVGP